MNAQHDDGAAPSMVDLVFVLRGRQLPHEHRVLLAAALEAALPWLAGAPGAGVHRLNVADAPAGGAAQALLAQRTRLVLRLPRARAADAAALTGQTLDIGGHALCVGALHAHELRPWGTLYAHLVALEAGVDEAAFMQQVEHELGRLGLPCRPICGRPQRLESGRLQGHSLMLDGLSAAHSLRLQDLGLGPHRRLGCGLFVPHRSAAAVGAPA